MATIASESEENALDRGRFVDHCIDFHKVGCGVRGQRVNSVRGKLVEKGRWILYNRAAGPNANHAPTPIISTTPLTIEITI